MCTIIKCYGNAVSHFKKPQDSFGEFKKYFSWSSESAGNHQKTPSDLPANVLNDILYKCNVAQWQIIIMYITYMYGKVFGGDSEHFYVLVIFWKWKHFGANC